MGSEMTEPDGENPWETIIKYFIEHPEMTAWRFSQIDMEKVRAEARKLGLEIPADVNQKIRLLDKPAIAPKEKIMASKSFNVQGDGEYKYPACYTLAQFIEKYGERNVLWALGEFEGDLYRVKVYQLMKEIPESEPDRHHGIEVAIAAWKPTVKRPKTVTEILADDLDTLTPEERADFAALLREKHLAAQNLEREAEAQRAAEQAATMQRTMEERLDAQQEAHTKTIAQLSPKPLVSFEELAKEKYDPVIAEANQQARRELVRKSHAGTLTEEDLRRHSGDYDPRKPSAQLTDDDLGIGIVDTDTERKSR